MLVAAAACVCTGPAVWLPRDFQSHQLAIERLQRLTPYFFAHQSFAQRTHTHTHVCRGDYAVRDICQMLSMSPAGQRIPRHHQSSEPDCQDTILHLIRTQIKGGEA